LKVFEFEFLDRAASVKCRVCVRSDRHALSSSSDCLPTQDVGALSPVTNGSRQYGNRV